MTDLVLTVQGSARAELDPERATLRFSVSADGPERAPVVETVSASLSIAHAILDGHHDPATGPVLAWSADQVSVNSQRPWTNDGSVAAVVHRASSSGSATLTADPATVAELIDALVEHPAIAIDALEWSVTDDRLATAQSEVRARAVGEALAKARVLAAAVGRPDVVAVALADPGMLDGATAGTASMRGFEKAMAMDTGNGGFSLRPQPIVVEVSVDARFRG